MSDSGEPSADKPKLTRQHSDISVAPATTRVGKCVDAFVRMVVRRPCTVAGITMLVCIIMSVIVINDVASSDSSFFSSSQPPDMSHITSIEYDAYELAVAAVSDSKELTEEEEAAEKVPQQTQQGETLFFVFEAKGTATQIFTAGNVQLMKEITDKVVGDAQYEDFCLRVDTSGQEVADGEEPEPQCSTPLSPSNLFYGSMPITDDTVDYSTFELANFGEIVGAIELQIAATRARGEPINPSAILAAVNEEFPDRDADVQEIFALYGQLNTLVASFDGSGDEMNDVAAVLKLARHMMGIASVGPRISFYFDKRFATTGESRFSRGVFSFGRPLEGYNNRGDRESEQRAKATRWFQDNFRAFLIEKAKDESMDVLYFATPLLEDEFLIIILVDLSLAVGSMFVVFGWLWFQTQSLTVALAAIAEILLSLPTALFFYRMIFQLKYISGLVAMCLYIVLAIGADDVFVFMDAYRQSLYQDAEVTKSFANRMLWTYRRAAGAMLITSFTTMCAFMATALSPLAEVASFGIFAAITIAMDYVFVITWLPAVVTFWHNHWEMKPNCCCPCCHSKGCSGLCKKQEGNTTLLHTTSRKATDTRNGIELTVAAAGDVESGRDSSPEPMAAGEEAVEKRMLERFFEGKFADFIINKHSRVGIFVFFTLILIPIFIFVAQAKEATSPDEFFPSDHPFQRIFSAMNSEFTVSTEDNNLDVQFFWGVSGVNRDGVSALLDPDFKGVVEWDAAFEMSPAMQEHLVDVCQQAREAPFAGRDKENPAFGAVSCFVEAWRDWVVAEEGDAAWPVATADAHDSLEHWLDADISENRPGFTYFAVWEGQVGLLDGEVKFVGMTMEAQLRERGFSTEAELRGHYDNFVAFNDAINAGAPAASIQTALGSPGRWVWMHTQSIYVTSAITGASFGAFLAFFVLLVATGNIIVAFFSMFTIAGILTSVLAIMTMLGWELGNIVSINLTILGGFAVDYVVHLAHSYMHNTGTREERTRAALRDMGVSVLSGMITSVGASLMLFGTTLQFFSKFGGFLLMTVGCSWVWANFFFLALMATFGPEGGETMLGLKKKAVVG
mmetsp:Transcript_21686/g.76147  ORF Transcript_21686/g.76147 Transcript_21686/m.76147 type:complete len:1073 (-) Transcript_21686:77-3295(-)